MVELALLPELVKLEGLVHWEEEPTVLAHVHQEREHSLALDSERLAADPEFDFGSYTDHYHFCSAIALGDSAHTGCCHCQITFGLAHYHFHYPDSA